MPVRLIDSLATTEPARIHTEDDDAKPAKTFRFYPKVYKAAIATANGSGSYEEYSEKVRDLESKNPISMRHIMGLKKEPDREPVDPSQVDPDRRAAPTTSVARPCTLATTVSKNGRSCPAIPAAVGPAAKQAAGASVRCAMARFSRPACRPARPGR